MAIIVCTVPRDAKREDFAPFPASGEAIEQGCLCPHQSQWPRALRINLKCPVHELERQPQ